MENKSKMTCTYRLSETSADSESIYKIYKCVMSKTKFTDKLKFFRQVGEEIARIKSYRESPEIVVLLADWGQGKTTFLNIIEEALLEEKKNINKINFLDILRDLEKMNEIESSEISLIDEVESGIDFAVYKEYSSSIREFWIFLKNLANSKGNKIIYLSMTPSAFYKIFSSGGQLGIMFPETYYSFLGRIKVVNINTPSKLEFYAMLSCLLEFNNREDSLLRFMDLPFWTISQERRKYARFFNDIICNSFDFDDNIEYLFKSIKDSKWLNEEGETIRESSLLGFEKDMDKEEIQKFHRTILSRIIYRDEIINKLSQHVVKGFLIDYDDWVEIVGSDNIDDFILTYLPSKTFDNSLKVFVSEELDKVVYEGFNKDELRKILDRLKIRKIDEAYSLTWNFFESFVNTNVGGTIIDFKSREIKEKAIKFVNENLINPERELDSLYSFIKLLNQNSEEKNISEKIRLISLQLDRKYSLIIANITNKDDYIKLLNVLNSKERIINGLILLSNDFIKNNDELGKSIVKEADKLSISFLMLDLSTPIKRQLLYLNFMDMHPQLVRLREDIVNLRLGDLREEISSFLNDMKSKLEVYQLPVARGNKRPLQSINWVLFNDDIYPDKVSNIFSKVNELVNERFRIFGSKQFSLEDIESEDTLNNDIVQYMAENGIINASNGLIYYDDLPGKIIKNFAKNLSGYLYQRFGDETENVVLEYLLYLAKLRDKQQLTSITKIFDSKKQTSLDFLIYISIVSGEIINYIDQNKVINKIEEQSEEILNDLQKINLQHGYFITAKKRGAGIRSLKDMRDSLIKIRQSAVKALEVKDYRNYVRLSFVLFTLCSLYKDFIAETEDSENIVVSIKKDISKKVELINTAKKLIGIKYDIEEEKILISIFNNLDYNFENYISDIFTSIDTLAKNKEMDDLRNFIQIIQKNFNNEYNNLYLIVWEAVKLSLDGINLPFPSSFRSTKIFNDCLRLVDIGSNLGRLSSIISEIRKIDPEISRLREDVLRKREEVEKLTNLLRVKINEFN